MKNIIILLIVVCLTSCVTINKTYPCKCPIEEPNIQSLPYWFQPYGLKIDTSIDYTLRGGSKGYKFNDMMPNFDTLFIRNLK